MSDVVNRDGLIFPAPESSFLPMNSIRNVSTGDKVLDTIVNPVKGK